MMRLQKFLARAGHGGRRKCEQLILDGRVSVNGDTITEMGVQVDASRDVVRLDGEVVSLPTDDVIIALNKPEGCYTTMRDESGRSCVADLLPMDVHPSLYHIGRLDRDTTGIILFTTDGELGNELLHPSRHVDKEYIAQVRGVPTEGELDQLRRGVRIEMGERVLDCAPAEVDALKKLPNRYRKQDSCLAPGMPGTSFVRVVIHEGMKHQVKLMLGAIGHPVVHLHRTTFGPISCEALKQGEWRYVDPAELHA